MKKLLLLILSVAMIILMLAFVTSCGGDCTEHIDADKDGKCDECGAEVEVVCTEHKDDNDDVLCDICGEVYVKPVIKVEVDVAFNIKDQDGDVIPGVQVTFTPKKGGTPVVATADAAGTFTAKLEVGGYRVSYDYDTEAIGYYLTDTDEILVSETTAALDLKMIDNNPNGTAERPYVIIAGENEFTIPAGGSYYYTVYHSIGLILDVKSESVKVKYEGTDYLPVAGVATVNLLGEDTNSAAVLEIENTSDSEITLIADMYSRPGTLGNPYVIEDITEPITTQAINKDGIVYYSYTAAEEGTLTFTLSTVGASATMLNTMNSVAESTANSGNTITLTVSVGDKVLIDCSTSGETPVEITFALEFAAAE